MTMPKCGDARVSVRRLVSLAVLVGLLAALCCPSSVSSAQRRPQKSRRQGKVGRRWQDGDVRLVRGRTRSAGTVLLYHAGKWGAVCDDMWDVANSDVVCRQRGFPGSARPALKMEFGGRGRRRMWITQVQCHGNETRLLDCAYVGWGRRVQDMCPGQWRAVGVVCRPRLKKAGPARAGKSKRFKTRRQKWLERKAAARARKAAARRRMLSARGTSTARPPAAFMTTTSSVPARNSFPRAMGMYESGSRRRTVVPPSKAKVRPQRRNPVRLTKNVLDLQRGKVIQKVAKTEARRRGTTSKSVPSETSTTTTTPTTTTTTTTATPSTTTTPTTTTTTPSTTTTTPTTTSTTPTTTTTTPTTTTTTPTTTTTTPTTTTTTPTTTTTTPTTTTTTPSTTATTTTTTTPPTTTTPTTTTTHSTTMTTTPTTTTTTTTPTVTTTAKPSATTTTPEEPATPTPRKTTATISKATSANTTTQKPYENLSSATKPGMTTATDKSKAVPKEPETDVDLTKIKASREITLKDKDLRSEDALLLQADSPGNPGLELQLTGGRYPWEGRLEVRERRREPGPWGTICGVHWGVRETMVVCRELGLHYAKQPLQTNYFGGHETTKTYYSINCTGRESKLSQCQAVKISEEHDCPKNTLVAGVVCSTYLPDLVPDLRALKDSVRLQDRPLYYLQCALEENCLSSSAYELKKNSRAWRNALRRLLRFSTIVHNIGQADFRPNVNKAQWEWHTCHMHFHSMEVFAHYDILDQNGTRLAEGSKASFCLEDTMCQRGVRRNYACVGFGDQGLSVNCSDNYLWDIDCQWIDITDIEPGHYTFLMEVNPTMLVAELDFDNNVAHCDLLYTGYFASLSNCRHESLLDYR